MKSALGICCMLIEVAEKSRFLHQHEFPDLDTVTPNPQVAIRKCWSNGYRTAEEVIRDLEATLFPSYPHPFTLSLDLA